MLNYYNNTLSEKLVEKIFYNLYFSKNSAKYRALNHPNLWTALASRAPEIGNIMKGNRRINQLLQIINRF
jgi:hypothetical protein